MGRTNKGGYRKPKNKKCVGIKRGGESCTKNNNCTYPDCPPTFDEFYKAPYKNDWGVVMSSNNNWAWTFKDFEKEFQELVMLLIEGFPTDTYFVRSMLRHEGATIFLKNSEGEEKMIMQIRGWGALTGTGGGLGLDGDTAAKIQDDFCDWIISKISK